MAVLASLSVLIVVAATTAVVSELRTQATPGSEPTISSTATPSPSFEPGGPTVRALGHQFEFPAGWTVPTPTPVVESLPSHKPLVEDISPIVRGSAIHLDLRVFARHAAHRPGAQVHSLYPTRTVSIAGHRIVIARPVVFPSSWQCTTPEDLLSCQKYSSSAPAVPWSVDTVLAIGVHLDHDYARINSTGLTADQTIALLRIML
jgi:hypothetical protein